MPSKKHVGTLFFNLSQLDVKFDSPMFTIYSIPNNLQAIEHTFVKEYGVTKFNMDDYLVVDEIDNANQTIPILALMSSKLEFIAIVEHPTITPSSLIFKVVHDVFIVQPSTIVFNRCGTTTFSKTR
jgi:hypothetical protein